MSDKFASVAKSVELWGRGPAEILARWYADADSRPTLRGRSADTVDGNAESLALFMVVSAHGSREITDDTIEKALDKFYPFDDSKRPARYVPPVEREKPQAF